MNHDRAEHDKTANAVADTAPGRAPESGGMDAGPADAVELSVVMPCLNESEALASCIRKALGFFAEAGVAGEVIVADNGSTDGSIQIAEGLGVRVVNVAERGYGWALAGGIAAARGRYIFMGDADGSYDFSGLGPFLEQLRGGFDLVMGNRFAGGISQGAMPVLHRYLGNPLLTRIGRLFFKSDCRDFYCGLRGFSRDAYQKMKPRSGGMEFALEMLVRATMFGLKVTEVPTTLSPDAPGRAPHLRTWRDGWRSLRFFMLFSPRWLFWYPGMVLMCIGALVGLWLLPGPRRVGGVTFDVHTLLFSATAVTLGYQSLVFAACAKVLAVKTGLHPPSRRFQAFARLPLLEWGLLVGSVLIVVGLVIVAFAIGGWSAHRFGDLDPFHTMRLVIPSALAMTLGVQTVFAGCFLGLLGMRGR
jgi:glycosyltransferase involved in cell wall biosynthesis